MGDQAPAKRKLIVSDFHIGDGKHAPSGHLNIGEDFHHDGAFVAFLRYYLAHYPQGGDVELIINGDFLNFLFVSYRGCHPLVITREISLEKLQKIIQAHPALFDCLALFAQTQGFRISYVLGNHDIDLIWPECQTLLNERLGAKIHYYPLQYVFDGIHVEHGNRFELMNYFDINQPVLTEEGTQFLNLPFGSVFASLYVVPMKAVKPHVDKIKPFRLFLLLNFLVSLPTAIGDVIKLFVFFASMAWSPLKSRFPALRYTTQLVLAGMTVYPSLDRYAKSLLRAQPNLRAVIFGHTHVSKRVEFDKDKVYFNSGTWNEITALDLSQLGKREQKTFLEIRYPEPSSQPSIYLKVWHGLWQPVSDFQT
jgi:UDP-2,3-diacylglucosamine pyrophosphatase LpxH